MSRYWRLVNVSGGRVTGTFWVSAPTRNGSTWVKAVDVTVWDDDQHTWGRWVTDMTAAVQDGVVDLSEHMIDRRVRVDVLAQRAAVEAAILAAAEAVTWSPDEPEVNAILAEEQTFVVCADEDPIKPADAALIAHAPDDLRHLLDALAAERAAARGYLERAERAEAERDRSASVRDAEAQRRTQAEARMRHLHAGLVALSFEMCPADGRRLRDTIGDTP